MTAEDVADGLRVCEHCQKQYKPYARAKRTARFCSARCRQAAWSTAHPRISDTVRDVVKTQRRREPAPEVKAMSAALRSLVERGRPKLL